MTRYLAVLTVIVMMCVSEMGYIYLAGSLRGCNFVLCACISAVPICPSANMRAICGWRPFHRLQGLAFVELCLIILYLNATSRTASSQNWGGSDAWWSAALALMNNVLLILSAMEFSCG